MKTIVILSISFLAFTPIITFAAKPQLDSQQRRAISETARLYLESMTGYVPGGLVTESQIEELQQYLRLSLGASPATHRGLLHRTLKDTAPLCRFFYKEQGSEILSSASSQLGGYAEIEALSLSPQGREVLQRAIIDKSTAEIISMVEAKRQNPIAQADTKKSGSSSLRQQTIYTLDDYLETALGIGSVEASANSKDSAQ
ncbi:hypothetical protein [Bythopirellula polymerisocia]|uniref:Uncharacterized protein n=1 Tax=Bythopirellula polymerisocia TaxID=2528003 RepID=A0A5C6CSB5_9BACT|nr:hypothetical protein [Bythopirellula polymerisocia]TWU27278.1 hypothetical protein Pla144_20500 [Bythopirellula polymerisocia]